MGLFRLILLGLAIWLLFRLYQRFIKGGSAKKPATHQIDGDMVKCKHCGIHIPQSEAISNDGNHYCSRAHLEADKT